MADNMNIIGILVDLTNTFFGVSRNFDHRKVDYESLIKKFGDDTIYLAKAFGQQNPDTVKGFITCLEGFGYDVSYTPPKMGRKGPRLINCNVAITVESIQLIGKVEVIVLVSSQLEFLPLIKHLQANGVNVHMIGCNVPQELVSECWKVTEIDESFLEQEKQNAEQAST